MFFRPAAESAQWFDQSSSESREGIFNPRRNDRINLAIHQAIPFEAAESLGEHLLRNAANLAMNLCVTHRFFRQQLNNDRRPFVSDAFEDETRGALRVQNRSGGRTFGHLPF